MRGEGRGRWRGGPWHEHGFRGGPFRARARRGDIKLEILAVLKEGPRHGYDIMLAIEARRGGFRPSPGSIYPSLQLLEDEECITSAESGGKRVYTIAQKGLDLLERQSEARAAESDQEDDDVAHETIVKAFKAIKGLAMGAKEIARSGNPQAIKKAVEVLDRARREIYQILAEDL